jgi:hypothetical protein
MGEGEEESAIKRGRSPELVVVTNRSVGNSDEIHYGEGAWSLYTFDRDLAGFTGSATESWRHDDGG